MLVLMAVRIARQLRKLFFTLPMLDNSDDQSNW
jgi:hypothetical protein